MLNEIKDLKLKHLHKLTEEELLETSKILSFLKPSDKLGRRKAKSLFEMSYGEVERIKNLVDTPEGKIEAVSIVFDCSEKYLLDYRITQFYGAMNYVTSQLNYIHTIEMNNLSKPPKKNMIDAGISRLDRFGPLNTLDALAEKYSKSPEEIESWSYNLVYHLLWKRKIESDIQDDYEDIMKSKRR